MFIIVSMNSLYLLGGFLHFFPPQLLSGLTFPMEWDEGEKILLVSGGSTPREAFIVCMA